MNCAWVALASGACSTTKKGDSSFEPPPEPEPDTENLPRNCRNFLLVNIEIGVDVLHVVVLVETFDQLEQFLAAVVIEQKFHGAERVVADRAAERNSPVPRELRLALE